MKTLILFLKQQNVEDKIYRLGREEFMVDDMTKQQLLMYENFATLNHWMDSFLKTTFIFVNYTFGTR